MRAVKEVRARDPRLALATVIAEGFFGRLAFGMLSFAFPLYALSLGMSLAEIGVLVSLRSVLVLPFKPVAGWLADRVGIRAVYLLGSLMRVVAAVALFFTSDFLGLAAIRALQGISAAGRDVASLGVVVRDAETRVASAYSWYATAKHVGGVAGAALAGVAITASGGSFEPIFALIVVLAVVPLLAAWVGLRETVVEEVAAQSAEGAAKPEPLRASEPSSPTPAGSATMPTMPYQGMTSGGGPVRLGETRALLRSLAGPASVGMLVAASAYMVHGIFPVLATEYAGLSEAQAGIVYSLSAVVFLVAGPLFGWLSDRYGRAFGLAWRSAANIGSSLVYLASPTFPGIAAARALDDSGKAAFRPAWASAIAGIASSNPKNRGRVIGALDTASTAGEVIGPALAGILWQTGGVVALFGARIVVALVAEVAAIRVFGEWREWREWRKWRIRRMRPSSTLTALAYLAPTTLAFAVVAVWLGSMSGWGTAPILVADLVFSAGVMVLGVLAGALVGMWAAAAERRAAAEAHAQELADLRHDLRGSLTVMRGEVELILSRNDISANERHASAASLVREVERADEMLGSLRSDGYSPGSQGSHSTRTP